MILMIEQDHDHKFIKNSYDKEKVHLPTPAAHKHRPSHWILLLGLLLCLDLTTLTPGPHVGSEHHRCSAHRSSCARRRGVGVLCARRGWNVVGHHLRVAAAKPPVVHRQSPATKKERGTGHPRMLFFFREVCRNWSNW